MPFIPHTEEDIQQMLSVCGLANVDELFSEIPKNLQNDLHQKLAPGLNELDITKLIQKKSKMDDEVINYIGAGAYEHHIPAAVWDIATRGEFMTSYTPYQSEASQGNLQLIYEYQTMICNLTAMDASNASMYDGASSLAEAILMGIRSNKNISSNNVLLLGTIPPYYIKTVKAIIIHENISLFTSDFDNAIGCVTEENLKQFEQQFAVIVIAQPNFFGGLENVNFITNWAHKRGYLVVALVNPTSLALLEAPGLWGINGADIVCGEGQPLGVPISSGGPYFGFLACKLQLVRQMPGRIVGRTNDEDGKEGFVLTLQAREQHIRRSKATSNICTNQGLLVTAATIYMSLLGSEGLERVARMCWYNTNYLADKLCKIPGIKKKFNHENFHEIVIEFDKKFNLNKILHNFAKQKISAGLNLSIFNKKLNNCLLICVTETKDIIDIDHYVACLSNIIEGF